MLKLTPGFKLVLSSIVGLTIMLSGHVHAQTLHAILVGDTLDSNIGPSDAIDLDKMKNLVQTAAGHSDMQLNLLEFRDRALNRQEIMNAVENLRPGRDDTVVFYYTGHGYRTDRMQNPWPAMALANHQGLDLYWVYNTLQPKNPRLLVVLMDACNGTTNISDTVIGTRSRVANPQNYRALFREARGAHIMTSSKPGEYSWADNRIGSAWTRQFMSTMETALSSPGTPTWDNLLNEAAKPVTTTPRTMHPVYAIQDVADRSIPSPRYYDHDLADGTGPAPPAPPTSPPGSGTASGLGDLLLQLERSIRYESQNNDWRSARGNWMASVENSNNRINALRDALLELERSLTWAAHADSWRSERSGWLDNVRNASNERQLRQVILDFERSIKWDAQYASWSDNRSSWLEAMNR